MKTILIILLLLGFAACTSEAQQEVRAAFPDDKVTIMTDAKGLKWAVRRNLMDCYFVTQVVDR